MANPQKENGFTAIANEIMDALIKIRIPGEARQVLDLIIRQTYGWNKKQDAIALTQFVEATGLSKVHVCRMLNRLYEMNIITNIGKSITKKGNEISQVYEFNKNYETWKPLPKKVTLPKKVISITKKGNKPLPILDTTKDIKYNKTIKGSKNPDPKVKIFIDWWYKIYQYKFNEKYIITNGSKIGEQVKSLLKTNLPFQEIQLKAMLFMADKDPFLIGTEERSGAGYDIGIFLSRINKYSANTIRDNENFKKWLVNEQGEFINGKN